MILFHRWRWPLGNYWQLKRHSKNTVLLLKNVCRNKFCSEWRKWLQWLQVNCNSIKRRRVVVALESCWRKIQAQDKWVAWRAGDSNVTVFIRVFLQRYFALGSHQKRQGKFPWYFWSVLQSSYFIFLLEFLGRPSVNKGPLKRSWNHIGLSQRTCLTCAAKHSQAKQVQSWAANNWACTQEKCHSIIHWWLKGNFIVIFVVLFAKMQTVSTGKRST